MITPTIKRWSKVVHTSVFCSILISSFFGLIGFLTFAQSTQGDIFENYCHKDDLINVIRLLYAMIIMFSYPLESFVCRDVITNALAKSRHVDNIFIHVGVTLAIALSTILFSFLTDCLGVVLEINGSLIATTLGYIIPSMCAIKINYSRENSTLKGFLLPITILLIGLVVFISGMHSVLHKIMKNELKCSHGNEMFYCKTLNSTMY
jgi:sodium-coupled neutral amino acid transporter 11